MVIYFIRHGETEGNKNRVAQGHSDSPLTLKGVKNVEKLGKILQNKNIEIIYSSDLGRCVQTAKIINKYLNLKIIKTKDLRERNFGIFNGKDNKIIQKNFDLNNPYQKAPNGESFNQMKKRVISFLKKILKKRFNSVLLVVHEGTARAVLNRATSPNKIYSIKQI